MNGFVDLHAHFLPAVDDGAKTTEEALAILSDCYAQGTRLIVATPHCTVHRTGDIERFLLAREASRDRLLPHLESQKHPDLLYGAEVYVDHDVSRDDGIERLCIEGTSLMLLEPMRDARSYAPFAETVYSLSKRGVTALIAHVDRYPRYTELMRELRGLRAVYQLNAARFLSFTGRRLVRRITADDGRFLVASDTHNTTLRRSCMKNAYAAACRMDPSRADEWFSKNADALLAETTL